MRPPSCASALMTMFSKSGALLSRPLTLSVYWKSWPAGTGGIPTAPAVTSWLCCCTMLMMASGVRPRACTRSGSSQIRIAYWPAPNTVTLPTPGRRASSFCTLMTP